MIKITTHTIVRNEENWVWYSLMSWRSVASEMLVVDDSSTDRTSEIIKTIKDQKIKYSKLDLKTPADHTEMRNEMIKKTKTDWFFILDGDEVWNEKTVLEFVNFLTNQPKNISAVVLKTRNCVGDVYHYQPENAGKYEILGRRGNLNIRAFRKLPDYTWQGDYPLESYANSQGSSINDDSDHLSFFDGFYWHMTFLPRTSVRNYRKHPQSVKSELGIKVTNPTEFPEVFNLQHPEIVPSPWSRRTLGSSTVAALITPVKKLKRHLFK